MSVVEIALFTLEATRADEGWDTSGNPDLWLYRDRTIAILRKFLHLSLETGRVPSLLGREFFRAKVTSYRMMTFEERVIFVHDVERCLEFLDEFSRQLIARITLQEYTHEEAAVLLHCCRKTIYRRYPDALDRLSEIFLAVGLLRPLVYERKGMPGHLPPKHMDSQQENSPQQHSSCLQPEDDAIPKSGDTEMLP